MRAISIVAALVTVAATVVLCLVVPVNRVISVGDDASALKAFKFYGYPETGFSLTAFQYPKDGRLVTPTFFRLHGQWHLQVWHDDRIESMMLFECVPHEHAYSDWINTSDVKSFAIPRATLLPYFFGFAVSFAVGWGLRRLRLAHPLIQATAVLEIIVGDIAAAGSTAFEILVSLGWAAAFVFGANGFRFPGASKPSPQRAESVAAKSLPAISRP
ncbi:MAG: hypothetical protein WCB27_14100 [Thermoguttaceae bacterium]|jgi:hypothetical protein